MLPESKYLPLTHYLQKINKDEVLLTFIDIENILNFQLPPSARVHTAWWGNDITHSQGLAWLNAGYRATKLSIASELIAFAKEE